MLSKKQKERLKYIREATFCIAAGTGAGLIVYGIFLYFNIAIFGWNLGLIFAPLIAGYKNGKRCYQHALMCQYKPASANDCQGF